MKKRIALALGYQRMLQQARFIHMIGQAELDATRAQGFRARLEMVPLGIRADEFEPLPPAGSFRSGHPRIKGRPYIVFLSRLHPGKGLDLLAKAFASIASRQRDLMLVVIGPDYGAQQELERIIADAGLIERLVLTGPLYGREKVAALCDAELFCMPSEHEACSVAILESLICGVPVVITPQCDRPEVEQVGHGGAGRIVPRDADSIAQAIESIISDPALRQSMSQAARTLALSRFTWDRVTGELVRLYQSR
jgi:glycosyltransferase involved in cell wall biosynthesis